MNMAWIQLVRRKDGTTTYWVRDKRKGRQVVIFGGITRGEAELRLEQYEIRRDLEKEGYDDVHEDVYDTDKFLAQLKKRGGGIG